MNILHVLSQFEVTGAETFAAALANEQIKNGNTVYIVSDTFHSTTKAQIVLHPIGRRNLKQRFENISFLKKFIAQKNIHVVNAHSRAASWVSFFATRRTKIPLVSHIHAQQHIHFSSKNFPIYGEKLVAVCGTIFRHLNNDLKYPLDKLALVKNGIDLSAWKFQPYEKNKKTNPVAAFVGRLSGFKGDTLLKLIEETFPRILEKIPEVEIHIIGGMNEKSKILPTIEKTNARCGKEFIIPKGFSTNVQEMYHSADVILGSGRVAMEALACGSTVIAVGESNYVGILSTQTEKLAVETNFGDLDKRQPIDTEAVAADILAALSNKHKSDTMWGKEFIENNFNIIHVAKELHNVYIEARAIKSMNKEIPVLQYKRITQENPAKGEDDAVSAAKFEKQLQFLSQKKFSALTFFDFQKIIEDKLEIPAKPVVLTFDCGYEDFYLNAFPLLQKYNLKAVVFAVADKKLTNDEWCRRENNKMFSLMNNEQISIVKNSGIEIGSQSFSHKRLNFCTPDEQKIEIVNSKIELEKRFNAEIISFAYPFGTMNEEIKHCVKNAGYKFAVAEDSGRRNFWTDFLKIRRIPITQGASRLKFRLQTSGIFHWINNVF